MLATAADARSFGNDVYAIGPGQLPPRGRVVSVDIAEHAYTVVTCIGGWSQNWDTTNNQLQRMPGIGVYDEGPPGAALHQRICPTVQPGDTTDASGHPHRGLNPQTFLLTPIATTIQAGDVIAVEVDITGIGVIIGGGELWNKAVGTPTP
ncbi:MAG TPA: hypothetical protein VGR91_04480 [Stellaceae bacterium]|nr:hypothetical protein [Stellaceae bacterium]